MTGSHQPNFLLHQVLQQQVHHQVPELPVLVLLPLWYQPQGEIVLPLREQHQVLLPLWYQHQGEMLLLRYQHQ